MRIGRRQAKGYLEEDFQEAFQRYISRSDMDALRAQLQARQVVADGGGPKRDDSGQSPEGGEEQPDANDPRPEIEGEKKDETG